MLKEIQDLIKISHYAAKNKAYIQGGGGNTSVKVDENQMAVKASGCKLSDMGDMQGYVMVDYSKLKEYFVVADENDAEFETVSSEILKSSVIQKEGLKQLRPSVEAGFHSLLKKYVIHTHSVYANILCCSKNGKEKAGEIFKSISFLWLPYVDPGAKLTLAISEGIKHMGNVPDVIFMENHGVIVSSDDAQLAIDLHEKVNNDIKIYFGLTQEFPKISIVCADGVIKSASPYVKDFFTDNPKDFTMLKEKVLYPDQLVYLNNSIYKKDDSQPDLYFNEDEINYVIGEKQALVNEETLVAYLYVIKTVEELGLELVTMTYDQQAFILGWESETYRKAMLK